MGCGLALVDFDEAKQIREDFRKELGEIRNYNTVQTYKERSIIEDDTYIDWKAWKLPRLNLARARRTAKSCLVKDWAGLEHDYMEADEAEAAQENPAEFVAVPEVKVHYPEWYLEKLVRGNKILDTLKGHAKL